jgi:proteasome lid subunit RPN8/RPN11
MTHAITISPTAFAEYRRTIARHHPETCALLGGRLAHPTHIEVVRFCPPQRTNGRYDASSTHISVDTDFMNWTVLHEWEPNGLYSLGVWHSHPGYATAPTGMGGDQEFFTRCLQSRPSIEAGWDHFLAPITTFDAAGRDHIHPWTYHRGALACTPASLHIVHDGEQYTPEELPRSGLLPIKTREPRSGVETLESALVAFAQAESRIMARRDLGWSSRIRLSGRIRRLEDLAFQSMVVRMKGQRDG